MEQPIEELAQEMNEVSEDAEGLKRALLESDLITRAINNTPISEILRVYSLALQREISQMSDDQIYEALNNGGYDDLLAKHFPDRLIAQVEEEESEV